MKTKAILAIMLTLLLIGVLFPLCMMMLAFKPVRAQPTGVFPIKHRGSINPLMNWYTVVGILLNNGSSYASDIEVRCVFRDASDQLVTVVEEIIYRGGWLSFDEQYLPPGWTTPFEVEVTNTELSEQIASYEITVSYATVTDPQKTHSLNTVEFSFTLAERNELFEYEEWTVTGAIKNLATYNATDTRVQAIFLDSEGFPVGFGGNSISDVQLDTILPNDISYFSLETLVPIYSDIASVQGMIEADEAFGHFPALPFRSKFNVDWQTETFDVQIFSNSSLGNLKFDQPAKELSFVIAGNDGTVGFCNITIPKQLLCCEVSTDWAIAFNGDPLTFEVTETESYTSLFFVYQHSIKSVKIQGTQAIPEFSSAVLLLLFLIATSLAIAVYRRKKQ